MAVPSPKRAWRQSRTRRASGRGPERVPAPFVVGVNRSGTTLLRMMLDAHPDLTVPPETHFVPDLIERRRVGVGDARGPAGDDHQPAGMG